MSIPLDDWPTGFAPLDAAKQRIRDLEREVARTRELWDADVDAMQRLQREVERLKGETVRQGDLIRALIAGDRAKDPQL